MSSVRIRVNKSRLLKDGTYPLVIQVICQRQKKQISTGYFLREIEFDTVEERVRYIPSLNTRSKVKRLNKCFQKKKADINLLLTRLERYNPNYTIRDFIAMYKSQQSKDDFLVYMQGQIASKEQMQKIGISRAYKSTLRSLRKFLKGRRVSFADINSMLVEQYEVFLITNKVKPNSIAFYLRNFRAVYNRGKKEHKEANVENPFENVHTNIAKTNKRALKKDVIVQLSQLDLSDCPEYRRAVDVFLFSFNAMGMSFVDIMGLKKEKMDIGGDLLVYYRAKTNQMVRVPLNGFAKAILARYMSEESDYLFSFIDPKDDKDSTFYKRYREELVRTNYYLKKLGKELKLDIKLTTYAARHTWASEANSMGAPISAISSGLGHGSIKTTEIYISDIDISAIKQLNDSVTRL